MVHFKTPESLSILLDADQVFQCVGVKPPLRVTETGSSPGAARRPKVIDPQYRLFIQRFGIPVDAIDGTHQCGQVEMFPHHRHDGRSVMAPGVGSGTLVTHHQESVMIPHLRRDETGVLECPDSSVLLVHPANQLNRQL